MTLKVIGAGFGRTGTDSMREALNILGFGPCHHMFEVNTNAEQKRLWRALVKGEPIGWDEVFAGYQSCIDWPSAYYWRELMAFYPQAKVVLTHRSAESWWASVEKTLLPMLAQSTDPESLGVALVYKKAFGGRIDREHAIAKYEANVAAVKAEVPPARLLVHNLGDGWEPLCKHLGVPVPAEPYPSLNSAGDFQSKRLK